MKTMKILPNAYEMLLEKLAQDDISLYNLPHTCIENEAISNIQEAIRDTLTGHIVHSQKEYHVTLYYTSLYREEILYTKRCYEMLKGCDIAQWVMDHLPNVYSTFAIKLRPTLQDPSKKKVWVFTMF